MKKLYIFILLLIQFLGSTQKIYVDAANTSGVESGNEIHPFNTVEEGITGSKTGNYGLVDTNLQPESFEFSVQR